MSSYCVIGSGISGATIANLLSKKNSVHIYDKARGPGGRSSFKRLNKSKGFDHGAQYISPKSIQFKKFITNLRKKKILKKWSGKHIFLNKLKKENKNHVKIIGRKGNNDISKHLIKNINCNFQSELEKIKFVNKKWKLVFKKNKTKLSIQAYSGNAEGSDGLSTAVYNKVIAASAPKNSEDVILETKDYGEISASEAIKFKSNN